MADLSKIKTRGPRLGAPPPLDEASTNLQAPELAPAAPAPAAPIANKIDGRALRRTGRTEGFNTKVNPEWAARLRQIAAEDGLKLVEVLERALDVYEQQRQAGR